MRTFGFGPGFRLNRRGGTALVLPGFDFTPGVLPAGASLARASAATRYDATGALVGMAADTPRFDYDPGNGNALRGLLIEPAATNNWRYSRDISQGTAFTINVTVTASQMTEPSGTVQPLVGYGSNNASGTTTLSFVAQELPGAPSRRYATYRCDSGWSGGAVNATFDLVAGTCNKSGAGSSGVAVAMRSLGGGAWLCSIGGTTTASNIDTLLGINNSSSAAAAAYSGNTSCGMKYGEVQVEASAVPTSRIPTSGAAASRSADVLTLNWGTLGVADGAITVRYTFDDGSTQDVAATVSGGVASVPTGLNRPWLRRAEKV